jgi:hypothetical protein
MTELFIPPYQPNKRGPKRWPLPEVPIDKVPCPRCEVADGPCVGVSGNPRATPHTERVEWREELLARCEGTTQSARWHRVQLRKGHFAAKPQSQMHGTESAYQRHKRLGEEPCAECVAAARAVWAVRHRAWRQRQNAKVATESDNR